MKGIPCTARKKDAQTYLNGKMRERDLGTYASVQHTLMGALFDDLLADYKINGKCLWWAAEKVRVSLRPYFGGMKAELIERTRSESTSRNGSSR